MITPEDTFFGRKIDVSHFRIFGASIYFHASKDSRKKLEPTSKMRVFVGYTETLHNYRVYFPSLRVIVVRRDIKFDEDKAMRFSPN